MFNRQATYWVTILAGLLLAGAVSRAQVRITTPVNGDVSPLNSQFVAGTGPSGASVYLFVNGVASDTVRVRPDGKFEFIGVTTPAGPIVLTAVIRSSNGIEMKDERRMHIIGAPDSLVVASVHDPLQADGRTPVAMTVRVLDKWGYRISNSYFATIDAGALLDPAEDEDKTTAGLQRRIVNGESVIRFTAPKEPGDVTVKVAVNALSGTISYTFTTPIEPLMLVGSADASATRLSTSGDLSAVKGEHLMNEGFHSEGRLAFYGRGTIWSEYLLTASYDNTRRQDRLFQEVDPDVLYSIYGDNSTIDYTAQSNNPFFMKIERNRSYALFGDFNTGLSQNELARYDRTFNGAKVHLESKTGAADIFATLTDRKVVQEEIRGQGISGFYFLGKSNIVVGTEKVRIETRDKLHNEVILSRLEKGRFGDYEIDYQQGTLFFKQPVASIDGNGNPVYIVVSYEAATTVASEYSYVVGAQGEQEVLAGLRLGATLVHDRSNNNFTLLGANTKYSYRERITLGGEFARGFDKLNDGGNAWKIDARVMPIEKLQLRSYYRKVDAGFMNQTMGAGGVNNEAGSTKYGAGASYTGFEATKLATEYYRSQQISNNKEVLINSIVGSAEHAFGSVATLGAKVENVTYETPDDSLAGAGKKQSTVVGVRGTVKPAARLNIIGEYEHSLSSSESNEVKPSSTSIGAEYKIVDPVTLSASEKFYSKGGSATVFGISTELGYGTSAVGRYQLGSSIGGERNQYSIGLKNILHLTEDLTSNVSYERTRQLERNLLEAQTDDNDAFSVGLEYLPKSTYKLSIKGELGKTSQATRRVVTFGGDVRLADDITVIEKFSYFEEAHTQAQASTGTTTTDSTQAATSTFADGILSSSQIGSSLSSGMMKKLDNIVGLAYRPAAFDWFNAVGKFEKKMEFNGIVAPQTSSDVNIFSLHTFVEPFIGLGIGTKYAMKLATEEAFGLSASTTTDFYLVRAEYDLKWQDLDVAGEYRHLESRIVDQANSSSVTRGYSAELGCSALKNIRIGVGYNFAGMEDRDLVNQDYWSAGPFLSIRAKFTEKILDMFHSK